MTVVSRFIRCARSRRPWLRAVAVATVGAAVWLGCTTTVVDKSARPTDSVDVFEQQMKRAGRFHKRGLHESAARHYDEAVRTTEGFAPSDRRRVQSRAQRAELRLAMGDYAGAEADYKEIVTVERLRARGPSKDLANALNNLSVFYIDLERIPEADTLLAEALEIRRVIYGEDHPFVAVLMQNLADAQRRARNYSTAEALFVRALQIYVRSGEQFYREASIAQNGLAKVYRETRRAEDAEKNHLGAIRLSVKAGGELNPDVGVFSRDLANLYTQEARYDEAEGLYKGSIAILRDVLGEKSYQLSKSYRDYAAMLRTVGRRRESASYQRLADATGY